MKIPVILAFLGIVLLHTATAVRYNAAVISYTPEEKETANLTMVDNVAKLISQIPIDSHIVVFPEYGITALSGLDNFREFAVEVPFFNTSVNVCDNRLGLHKVILDLACGAREKNTYIVANLLERNGDDYHNTNFVFNKNGSLVTRYRKINLWADENEKLVPGANIVTFETSFGAKFTTFTCYDILFKFPAVDVFNDATVTDVAFPTAWFSQLPLLHSLSAHEGYASRHGVNLLSANYNKPSRGASGSGIFAAGGQREVHLSTTDSVKALILEVNSDVRHPERVCSELNPESLDGRKVGGKPPGLESFGFELDIKNQPDFYSFQSIANTTKSSNAIFCSPDERVCCEFRSFLRREYDASEASVRYMTYSNGTAYGCGLVLCVGGSNANCTTYSPNTYDIVFENITITTTTIPEAEPLISFPSTLNYDMEPIYQYKFCDLNGKIEMKANVTSGLRSFGFFAISGGNLTYGISYLLAFFAVLLAIKMR